MLPPAPARRAAAATLALLAAVSLAPAYQYESSNGQPRRWPSAQATVFTDPVMPAAHAQAIHNASITWSTVPGSVFQFVYGGNSHSADVRNHNNGTSDLYFDTNLPPLGYAVTYAFETGPDIVERDVAFNGNLVWTTTGSPGGAPDVETVALHELGHVLGLMHESGKPAVMNPGGDPSIVRTTLYDDDRDGVKFLYPAGGGGGGGGPRGPDLAAGTLLVTQGVPGAGNQVFLRAEVKNLSTLPGGPFRVKAVLVTSLPTKASDPEIGTADVLSLGGGNKVDVAIDCFIPAATSPGFWRLGVFADPENVSLDPYTPNNGAATAPFTVSVAPAAFALGDAFDAGLGPRGKDGGSAWVGEGTEVTLKARGRRGVAPVLRVKSGPAGTVLAEETGKARATLRWTAPADGDYFLEAANAAETVGRVRLETSGRTLVRNLALTAPAEFPFAAYEGGTVRLLASWEGTASPILCRPPSGPDISSPGTSRGRRAKLGPIVPSDSGAFTAILGGEGPVRLSLDARSPADGTLVVH